MQLSRSRRLASFLERRGCEDEIGQGEIDTVELTEHFLSQIELSPIGKKIYSTVTSKLALEQAKESKRQAEEASILANEARLDAKRATDTLTQVEMSLEDTTEER